MLNRQRNSDILRLNQVGKGLFFSLVVLDQFQEGVCQQGQRDVAIPALPMTHLVVGQSSFAFGFFDQWLNGVPGQGDTGQFDQGGLTGRIGHIAAEVSPIIGVPPDQQPLLTDFIVGHVDAPGTPLIPHCPLLA